MPNEFDVAAAKAARLPRLVTEASAKRFDDIARASAARAIGNGGSMSVRGGGRVRLSTSARGKHAGSISIEDIRADPPAQWRWIEDGTRPHAEGAGVILGGPHFDHPVRGPVQHPGARGKQAWSKALAEFAGEFQAITTNAGRTI